MRHLIAPALVLVCLTPHTALLQSGTGRAAAPAAPRACALLTKELVIQVTPYEKQALNLVLVEAMEDSLGASGSACHYGGITLQIDPFPPATFDKQRTKEWIAVPRLGDAAYFRDNAASTPNSTCEPARRC